VSITASLLKRLFLLPGFRFAYVAGVAGKEQRDDPYSRGNEFNEVNLEEINWPTNLQTQLP